MLKTFLLGILLGIVAAVGALYAFPAVDQERRPSIISVTPNGGNTEVFHINIPMDRIMLGAPGKIAQLPEKLRWPTDEFFAGVRAELFKMNDASGEIVGVASRVVIRKDGADVVDWVMHLPARGSIFVTMVSAPRTDGSRTGRIRAGSREFKPLTGSVAEHWVVDTSGEEDAPTGRIELIATYVGTAELLE